MKMTINKHWSYLAGLLFLPFATKAQTPDTAAITKHAFSLQQTIDYAKKHNLDVKNALLDVQLQFQQNREYTSNALPHINMSVETTYNPSVATQVIPNFISPATYQVLIDEGVKNGNGQPITMPNDFGFIAAQFGTKFSTTAGVNLQQILFDGQVFVGLEARKTLMESKRKTAEVTEEMIKTNIYKVYYQLVVSKTQVELLDANIALLEKLLHDTKLIYQNGFAEKLDVDKVSVQLANLQTEKNKVMNTISNGYYGLKLLIGMPVTDELVLTDTLNDADIKEGILENSDYKYEDRKDFQMAQIGLQLNNYNIRRYRLSKIPSFTLNAYYAKNAQRKQWSFVRRGDWYTIASVSLTMNVPIFNGNVTNTKIREAQLNGLKIQNQIDALKNSIDNQVMTAKNNFRSAIATMDYQKKNMELAKEVYRQTKKKYEVGTGSQMEINTAQTDLKTAQSNYISSLYDAIIAKVDYLHAVGKLQ